MIKIGLESFLSQSKFAKTRLGLLSNQASIGKNYQTAKDLIDKTFPKALKTLFGPQHGFKGQKQDNMIESDHDFDEQKRPLYSLYGHTRRPTSEMLSNLDYLLIDLPDVGTRVYTYAHTMSYCLEKAAEIGLKVIILDRPNPIGGTEVEGNILQKECSSFVGLHPLPMRHGFTLGELALYINSKLKIKANLEIIKIKGWQREQYFNDTHLPWVFPSPNMPQALTAWLYPGQVIWEGTNISEGRGTTLPFHILGAPFIQTKPLVSYLEKLKLPGVIFRPITFEPTFHKWAFQQCQGLEIHPTDKSFKPYLSSLAILEAILNLWPHDFKLKAPPYEYEFIRNPLDLILGDKEIFKQLKNGKSVFEIEENWQNELDNFLNERKQFLLY